MAGVSRAAMVGRAAALVLVVALLGGATPLPSQNGGLTVSGGQLTSGGGVASSASFQVKACLGQSVAGVASSPSFRVVASCGPVLLAVAEQQETNGNGNGPPDGGPPSVLEIPTLSPAGWAALVALLAAAALFVLRRHALF